VRFTKPKIVLVGVGKFGKNHLRVLEELEMEGLCTLHGVVDMRGAVLEKVGRSHGVKISTDFNDFLTNDVDAIDIVTPTDTHFAFCYKSLEAGKHVFMEKPNDYSRQPRADSKKRRSKASHTSE